MNLAEPGEECEEGGPYADEEGTKEDENVFVLEFSAPQEGPVPSVSLGKGGLEIVGQTTKSHSPGSTSSRAIPTRRGTTTPAYDGTASCRSWEPLVASDGSTLHSKSAQ